MKIRCGPAAVIGYESREATVVIDGKGGRRTTREPEDLLALKNRVTLFVDRELGKRDEKRYPRVICPGFFAFPDVFASRICQVFLPGQRIPFDPNAYLSS